MIDAGITFNIYQNAIEHKRRMAAEYDSASRGLELASIKERASECLSQHQPIAGLYDKIKIASYDDCRNLLNWLIRYVVYGRKDEDAEYD